MTNPKIQLRHDTAVNWTSVNPVLLEGEVGIETDTRRQKIGDGSTPWVALAYDYGSTALLSITSSDVTNALGYVPYNSTNPSGYITGISSSDVTTALGYTPVNKAGDTITGILDIKLSDTSHSYESLRLIDGDVTYNTAPSSARGLNLRFLDKNKQLMGFVGGIRYPSNSTAIRFFCRNANGQSGEAELIGNSSNQFEFHVPTPASNSDSNTAATTEWVNDKGYTTLTTYENGLSGYVIFTNGFCIQWGAAHGTTSVQGDKTITFAKTFKNTNFNFTFSYVNDNGSTSMNSCGYELNTSRTTNSVVLHSTTTVHGYSWKACGFLASGQY